MTDAKRRAEELLRRYWVFLGVPLGGLLGWLAGDLPPWLLAVLSVVLTLVLCGGMFLWERRWRRAQQDELDQMAQERQEWQERGGQEREER
jgi:hypothetical protein